MNLLIINLNINIYKINIFFIYNYNIKKNFKAKTNYLYSYKS